MCRLGLSWRAELPRRGRSSEISKEEEDLVVVVLVVVTIVVGLVTVEVVTAVLILMLGLLSPSVEVVVVVVALPNGEVACPAPRVGVKDKTLCFSATPFKALITPDRFPRSDSGTFRFFTSLRNSSAGIHDMS